VFYLKIMQKINKRAFTLVELIVVITILAILWTIAFISLQWYSRDARDATRTADLWNIKTSLELFSLKTWKYPSPDSFSTITYSGWTEKVWYQWVLWDKVTTNLKSLNEKPLDPLTSAPYTYSVTNSYKEYEVLALYEWSVAYNPIINQTNAAVTALTPKIVWNYNWVFVKTTNYIIPTPSIVTSEPLTPWSAILLTSSMIKSQVITSWMNIPKNNLIQGNTWWLNINLSVYTWSLTGLSTTTQKANAMKQIQNAYSWTTIASNSIYSNILSQTTNKQLVAFIDSTVLKWVKIKKVDPVSLSFTYIDFTPTTITLSWSDIILTSNNIYPITTFNNPKRLSYPLCSWHTASLNQYCVENWWSYVSSTSWWASWYYYNVAKWYWSYWSTAWIAPWNTCQQTITTIKCKDLNNFTVEYNTSGNIVQASDIITTVDASSLTLNYSEVLNGQTLTPKIIINWVEKSLVNKVYNWVIPKGSTVKIKFLFTGTISQTPMLNNNITLIIE